MNTVIGIVNHKPFDLKEALKGNKFKTRGGFKVIDFKYEDDENVQYPLSVRLKNESKGTPSFIMRYRRNGIIPYLDSNSPYDLVMS